MYEKEVYQETDEELDRAMYHTAVQILAEEDYHQYEISNFAKDGKESRHNRIYWQDEGYLGFGLGAHSYWEGKRFHNPYDLHTYMEQAENGNVSMEDVEELSLADQYSEFMFMGLRLKEGIEKNDLPSVLAWKWKRFTVRKLKNARQKVCWRKGRMALPDRERTGFKQSGFHGISQRRCLKNPRKPKENPKYKIQKSS